MEANKVRKKFNWEEAKHIIEGTLDVTQFFQDREESTNRLKAALKGRPIFPGQKEREDILERASRVREEVQAFRIKYRIEDPPEYAARSKEMVIQYSNKYRNNKLKRSNIL